MKEIYTVNHKYSEKSLSQKQMKRFRFFCLFLYYQFDSKLKVFMDEPWLNQHEKKQTLSYSPGWPGFMKKLHFSLQLYS